MSPHSQSIGEPKLAAPTTTLKYVLTEEIIAKDLGLYRKNLHTGIQNFTQTCIPWENMANG
jgi:hypothetical protein